MSAAAGWYTDPHDPTRERYWTGTEWTADTKAPETAQDTEPNPAPTVDLRAQGTATVAPAAPDQTTPPPAPPSTLTTLDPSPVAPLDPAPVAPLDPPPAAPAVAPAVAPSAPAPRRDPYVIPGDASIWGDYGVVQPPSPTVPAWGAYGGPTGPAGPAGQPASARRRRSLGSAFWAILLALPAGAAVGGLAYLLVLGANELDLVDVRWGFFLGVLRGFFLALVGCALAAIVVYAVTAMSKWHGWFEALLAGVVSTVAVTLGATLGLVEVDARLPAVAFLVVGAGFWGLVRGIGDEVGVGGRIALGAIGLVLIPATWFLTLVVLLAVSDVSDPYRDASGSLWSLSDDPPPAGAPGTGELAGSTTCALAATTLDGMVSTDPAVQRAAVGAAAPFLVSVSTGAPDEVTQRRAADLLSEVLAWSAEAEPSEERFAASADEWMDLAADFQAQYC